MLSASLEEAPGEGRAIPYLSGEDQGPLVLPKTNKPMVTEEMQQATAVLTPTFQLCRRAFGWDKSSHNGIKKPSYNAESS